MSKRFSILLIVLTIVSGLIGGLISGRIFVTASEETKQSKILTAEELRIVDKSGKLQIQLGKEEDTPNYGLFISSKDSDDGGFGVRIKTTKYGGYIDLYGISGTIFLGSKMGKSTMLSGNGLSMSGGNITHCYMNDGGIGFIDKEGISRIKLNVSDCSISVRQNEGSAEMSVNNNGGRFDLFGKGIDKERATMQINEYGNGAIGLWDKNGYRLK